MTAIENCWTQLDLDNERDARDRAIWHTTRALARDVLDVGEILGVEMPLRGNCADEGGMIGFADLVLARPGNAVEIVDHKVTGWRATPRQLRDDFQLNLYGHLALLCWPDASRIIATHHYPTGPVAVSATLTEGGMTAARERVARVAARISLDSAFEPTPSLRCDHCPWLPSCSEGSAYLASRA